MDPLCFDENKEDIEAKSAEGSSTVEVDDRFGDPEIVPRVGDEYQAELPSLVLAPYLSQLMKKRRDSEMPEFISLGLPHCIFESSCGTLESVTSEEGQVISQNECQKVEYQTALLVEGKNVGRFSNFQSSSLCHETFIDSYPAIITEPDQSGGKDLLPGLLVYPSWTDIEYNRFLLCLYVFGKKNFNFLKKFIGSKNMGDILYFYYGKFYRSKGYRRWAECRKLRSKRYICGQKIFEEWRQQELLSRLFPHVSGECQTMLLEISRNFAEERMPFIEYVFALKDAVGVDLLIAAVGIGKGKQDLTSTAAVELTKTNHVISLHAEIPIGKACSSLRPADIIKILNGNFRLSKARSSDLFWEAVWPHLLAKGWRSEQPKDYIPSGSKQSLVFLVPGIKKFSRRRLVNGKHYFDSVSDVLTKVASEPGLIETDEIQATDGSVNRENRQEKPYLDGVSNRQQHCYLQPHSSKCDQDLMKFTIVDTSIVHDMGQSKVRQLRSLPFETVSVSIISSCSSESEKDTSEDSEDLVEQANSSNPIKDQVEQVSASYPIEDLVQHANGSCPIKDQVELANSENSIEDQVELNSSNPIEDQVQQASASCPIEDHVEKVNSSNPIEEVSDKGVSIDSSHCTPIPVAFKTTKIEDENHKCHSDLHNDKRSGENMKSDFSNYFPYMKMQKLSARNQDFSHCTKSTSMDRKFDLNEPISQLNLNEESEGSPNMSNEGSATGYRVAGEISGEKSKTRMLIDLNFPQVSPELETEVEKTSSMVTMQNRKQCANTSSSPSEVTQLNEIQQFPDGHEEQTIIANRRQSTRNRPLTTKALEALEYGFLNSKRKRKNTESSDSNSNSRILCVSSGTIVSAAAAFDKGIGNAMADARKEGDNVTQAYSCSIDLNREAHYNM